jgi:hypothetical protein
VSVLAKKRKKRENFPLAYAVHVRAMIIFSKEDERSKKRGEERPKRSRKSYE